MYLDKLRAKISFRRLDVILILTILLGLALRLNSLTAKGIWFDEANSIHFTFLSWSEILYHRYSMRPVYFLILKLLTPIIGTKAFALKSISVLFDTCSICLIYFVANELFDKRVARISAFLYSMSCLVIIWAQQIRNYSLAVLLTLISFYLFIKFIKNSKELIWVCFVNILLALSIGSGFFILIAQNIIFFLCRTNKFVKRKWIVGNIITVFVLAVFLSYSYIFGNLQRNWMSWIPKPQYTTLVKTLADFSFGGMQQTFGGSGFTIDYHQLLFSFLLVPIFLLFILNALVAKDVTISQAKNYRQLLLIWFLLPLLGLYSFSCIAFSVFFTRYILISYPAFILLTAKGINSLTNKKVKVIALCLIAFLMIQSLLVYYSIGKKENLRDLVFSIKNQLKPEDLITVIPTEMILPFMYYYLGETYKIENSDIKILPDGFLTSGNLTKNIDIKGIEIIIVDALNSSNLLDDATIERKIKSWPYYADGGLIFFDNPTTREKIFSHRKIWMLFSAMWINRDTIKKINSRMIERYRLVDRKYFRVNNVFLLEYDKKKTLDVFN